MYSIVPQKPVFCPRLLVPDRLGAASRDAESCTDFSVDQSCYVQQQTPSALSTVGFLDRDFRRPIR